MPLSGSNRTNVLAQLDSAFSTLEAGGAPDLTHQSIVFTLNGFRYVVSVIGGSKDSPSCVWLDLKIKRLA